VTAADITPARIGTLGSMKTDDVSSLLTVPEVAARLRVSRSTAWRLVHRGDLRAVKIGSGPHAPVRVDPAELESFLQSSRRQPPAGAADRPRSPHGGHEEGTG
jgi:excisionase family DNA binding protein